MFVFRFPFRDPGPVGRAAKMSGPADGGEGPAAAGPPGLLQEKGGDRDGILEKPGETGRALHGKDSQHQGSPAVQVRRKRCLVYNRLSVNL